MTVWVLMHDPTETVCPVEAVTIEGARKLINESMGFNCDEWPLYRTDNDDDLIAIINIIENKRKRK